MKTTSTILIAVSFMAAMVLGSLGWPQGRAVDARRDSAQSEGPDVYVAGRVKSARLQGNWVATVWKNGIPQPLSDATDPKNVDSCANSVYVSGDDVYAAGQNGNVAVLWVNGVPAKLSEGNRPAFASSVFVSGSDVYVAGAEKHPTSGWFAMLWKNGKAQRLSRPSATKAASEFVFVPGENVFSQTRSTMLTDFQFPNASISVASRPTSANIVAEHVFVSDGDVYVAGFELSSMGKTIATLWKNGKAQTLAGGTASADASSVFVDSENVYVAISNCDHSIANIWKNGASRRLSGLGTLAKARAVFAADADVYVAGEEHIPSEGGQIATLWKNSEIIRLGRKGTSSRAVSLKIFGGDVYVAGEQINENGVNVAVLWKNGVIKNVSDGKFDAQVTGVFVK